MLEGSRHCLAAPCLRSLSFMGRGMMLRLGGPADPEHSREEWAPRASFSRYLQKEIIYILYSEMLTVLLSGWY